MISSFGYYSLLTATLLSLLEIITYIKNYNQKNYVAHQFIFYKFSFYFIIISFILLIISFANSDFSIISVYENSHTAKPLFYKIAATWGNHEGSILLFILVISAYGYCFIISKRKIDNRLRATVVFIQNILLIIFLFFLLFTSNPFEKILPIPNEGLGLNPILQDPLLVIHPPFLYLGYVGFSLIFSLTLAALINNQFNIDWSKLAKNWIFLPWTFLTVGIGLGSFWAYYELGWGGYWFWDPVENASLMPWIAATALIHSVLVMEKTGKLFSWTAILALLTFILSLFGTFLVRSGVLNSVHAFANDPERGLYILIIISLLAFVSLSLFIIKIPKQTNENHFTFLSRENVIVINNYFLIFFLTVVIIGTTYPILLAAIVGKSISVGPQYYNSILAPFVFIFLLLMATGPFMKWKQSAFFYYKNIFISFLLLSVFIATTLAVLLQQFNPLFLLGILTSCYLIISTFVDIFYKKNFKLIVTNLSRFFSHLGFAILILSITLNYFFSKELTTNIKLGENIAFDQFSIQFKDSKTKNESNYQELFGTFNIKNENMLIELHPSIRKYIQPSQFTSETSIKNNGMSDYYMAMDYSSVQSEGIGIRFYYNYFIRGIWLSFILITLGGCISFYTRRYDNKI